MLWEILDVFGFPPKVIALIRGMHDGARTTVFVNGESAEPFVTTNGLKQGSVLSPILFNIFFGTIIHAARAEWKAKELGIKLTSRPTGNMFDKRSRAKESPSTVLEWLTDIGFADDCVICARCPEELQSMLDILNPIIKAFGQDISVPKTKIMDICTGATANIILNSDQANVQVLIDGQVVGNTAAFKYLGSFESNRGVMVKEVSRVIQAMHGAFERL
jgi:hypothetical protein